MFMLVAFDLFEFSIYGNKFLLSFYSTTFFYEESCRSLNLFNYNCFLFYSMFLKIGYKFFFGDKNGFIKLLGLLANNILSFLIFPIPILYVDDSRTLPSSSFIVCGVCYVLMISPIEPSLLIDKFNVIGV